MAKSAHGRRSCCLHPFNTPTRRGYAGSRSSGERSWGCFAAWGGGARSSGKRVPPVMSLGVIKGRAEGNPKAAGAWPAAIRPGGTNCHSAARAVGVGLRFGGPPQNTAGPPAGWRSKGPRLWVLGLRHSPLAPI